jgi:hypothetical protein
MDTDITLFDRRGDTKEKVKKFWREEKKGVLNMIKMMI